MNATALRPDKAQLTLKASPELSRDLRLELSAYNFLRAAVYVKNQYLSQATAVLPDCFVMCDAKVSPTHYSLYIGMASFPLTADEWRQVVNTLQPLGLRVEERP